MQRAPEKANFRHHLASRCGQDHADREAAAVRRRDPDGGCGEGPQSEPTREIRLDAARAGARHLGNLVGDAVPLRRRAHQPARHAGSRGLLRGHVSNADGGRQRAHGDRRGERRRGADDQAHGGVPSANHADHQLREQARPRRPRADRPARRHRERARASVHPDDLADRHGPRVPRHLSFGRGLRLPLSEPRRQPVARHDSRTGTHERRARGTDRRNFGRGAA